MLANVIELCRLLLEQLVHHVFQRLGADVIAVGRIRHHFSTYWTGNPAGKVFARQAH